MSEEAEAKTEGEIEAESGPDCAALLRQRRQELGWSLLDVVSALKISHQKLEALESGDTSEFINTQYTILFIRSYARHLGLDADDMARRFREEADKTPDRLPFMQPVEEVKETRSNWWLVLAAVVILIGIYGMWSWLLESPMPGGGSSTGSYQPGVFSVLEARDWGWNGMVPALATARIWLQLSRSMSG